MQIPSVFKQTGFIELGGDPIYYEIYGQGVPVIIIPANGGDSWWSGQMAEVLSAHYKVILFDLRGQARSITRHPVNYEISQHSHDAVALLKALGEESAHFVGTSSGAIIALDIAGKYPEAVRTIVAHEPPLIRIHPRQRQLARMVSRVYNYAFTLGSTVASMRFLIGAGLPFKAMIAGGKAQKGYLRETTEKRVKISRADEFLELITVTNYLPDMEILRRNAVRIIAAAGKDSLRKHRFYAQTAGIIARELGSELLVVPGHHLSFFHHAKQIAEQIRTALT